MAKQVTVRTDKDHRDALDAMQKEGDADSRSEAMRQTSRTELARRGYLNGRSTNTPLKRTVHKIANAFAWVAIGLIGATWFYPVSFRFLVFAPLISAGALYSFEGYLESREPDVSNRLKELFGRDTA